MVSVRVVLCRYVARATRLLTPEHSLRDPLEEPAADYRFDPIGITKSCKCAMAGTAWRGAAGRHSPALSGSQRKAAHACL